MATQIIAAAEQQPGDIAHKDPAVVLNPEDFLHLHTLVNSALLTLSDDTDNEGSRACLRAAQEFLNRSRAAAQAHSQPADETKADARVSDLRMLCERLASRADVLAELAHDFATNCADGTASQQIRGLAYIAEQMRYLADSGTGFSCFGVEKVGS